MVEVLGAIAALFAIVGGLYRFTRWWWVRGNRINRIVVDMVSLQVEEGHEELVSEKLGIPKHALVVRCRNNGDAPEILVGYGLLATKPGEKRIKLMESPLSEEDPGLFASHEYHEFVVDLYVSAMKLSKLMNKKGDVDIRGLYVSRDGTEYTSTTAVLNLESLHVTFGN